MIKLTSQQKEKLLTLPEAERRKFLSLAKQVNEAKAREAAQEKFLPFVKRVWPSFISGRHHKIMADAFDRIVSGDLKRCIIAMPPRFTKSEFGSIHLPSFFMGHFPEKKIIQSSHTAELAVGFGRKVRDLIASEDYQDIFPETKLKADTKAAGRWNTSSGGTYFAIGVGGAMAGIGADLLIIDDAHSDQEGMSSDPKVFDKVYEWYTSGPRQRMQPDGAILIIGTRWGLRDLPGRVLKSAGERGTTDEWEVIEFPAIMPSGDALWPEFWPLKELEPIREEIPAHKWNAQYMQAPTSEEGALIKRKWWKIWEKDKAPDCDFIIQSWDTAFLKSESADFSACTTWGVFYNTDDDGKEIANIILLDAYKDRLEFPDLKRKAHQLWEERKPDAFIVEAKASGVPLIFELRAQGIPVDEFAVTRGSINSPNTKTVRVNAIADLFASGMVWCPDTRWAREVMEECAAFPNGEHDDYVDATVIALTRFRRGGFIALPSDWEDDDTRIRQPANYY